MPIERVTRVLLAHGGVDVLDPDRDKPSLIRLAGVDAALARGAIHYVALGDKHSVTEVGGSGRIWYSGAPEVTNYDDIEANSGHVLVVDIDEARPQRPVTVDARHIGRWRFVTLHRQVDTNRDIADLDLNFDQMTDKDRTVVRLALTGSLTVTDRAALDACLDKYARLFASLGMWERHTDLAVIPADGEFTDLGIGGFAAAAVDELVATARAGDGAAAADAQGALALLLRLADGGPHEAAPAGPDELSGHHPPGDRVSRPRCGGGVRRQRDRQVVDDRGAGLAAGIQGPVDEEGSQTGQADRRRRRRPGHCRDELRALPFRLPQALPQEVRDRVDGAAAPPRTADRRRGARAGPGDAFRDGGQRSVARPAGPAKRVDRHGESVGLRRAVAGARCRGGAIRHRSCAVGRRAVADRPDRRRVHPLLHPDRTSTGEWAAAIARVSDAESAVAGCAAAVAEVDDRVRRHAALTERVAELSQQRIAARPRLVAAEAAAEKIAALSGQAREAELVAAAAGATSAASTAAHAGRLRLRTEIDTRAATVAQAGAEAQEAAAAQLVARADAEAADAAVEEAARVRAELQRRTESARRSVEQLAARAEADRLAARLAKIDDIQRDRDRIGQELSVVVITREKLQRIENAAAAVDRTGDQLASISAAVQFTAAADIELAVGDERVSLSAGQSWSITATGATEVEVPGVLTARITPGATALDVEAKHAAAQQELAAALAAADVADLQAARSADQRRRELHSGRDQLTATLAGLCGCDQIEDQIDQLRGRLEQLQAGQPAGASALDALDALDATAARAELEAAKTAHAAAEAGAETRGKKAAAAGCLLAEKSTRATVLQNKAATARAELDAAADRLAQERMSVSDDALASVADTALQAAQDRGATGRRTGRRAGRRRTGCGGHRIGRRRCGGRFAARSLRGCCPCVARHKH